MTQNDIDKGREALVYYFNEAQSYYGRNMTLDQLLVLMTGSPQNASIFLDGLGFAINQIAQDTYFMGSKTKTAMEVLANKVKDKIPNKNLFFDAIRDQAVNPSAIEALPSVIGGSVQTIVTGAQEVGNAVIDTGKSLLTVGPIVLVLAGIFLVYTYTKKIA